MPGSALPSDKGSLRGALSFFAAATDHRGMNPTPSPKRPVLLVTGGSRGIGAAVVRGAVARGWAVAFSWREREAAARALVEELGAAEAEIFAHRADVAVEAEVLALFAAVDARFGRLDGLVNNAGLLERQARVEHMDAARLQRVLGANVVGSFLCAREAVRRLSTRHGGRGGAIVNLSSRAARLGAANEYVDYAAAKAAVDTLTLGLAREVGGEGIRVNAVAPGLIDTEIHASGGEPGRIARLQSGVPLGRGGQPEEVAEAVLWLLSEAASYVTGSVLDVAGGR